MRRTNIKWYFKHKVESTLKPRNSAYIVLSSHGPTRHSLAQCVSVKYCLLIFGHSLVVARSNQAFLDAMCDCQILFADFRQWHAGHEQKQATGGVSMTPGAVIYMKISGSFLGGLSLQGYTQVQKIPGIYRIIYYTEGKKKPTPWSTKPGDFPPKSKLIAPLYHSLPVQQLQSPSPRSCGL